MKVWPPIEFDTPRLRMRQWLPSDLQPFAELNADLRVMEYFLATLDQQSSHAMAHRIRSLIEAQGWGFWAVEILATQQFIGFVGLHVPTTPLSFAPCVEIGWRLAYTYWGKGYATEAAIAALCVGFEQLGLDEIISFTAVMNYRSRAVMARIGMEEAEATFEHPNLPEDSPLREHCLYRMPRKQWKGMRIIS
jgi:hypothetical protein